MPSAFQHALLSVEGHIVCGGYWVSHVLGHMFEVRGGGPAEIRQQVF